MNLTLVKKQSLFNIYSVDYALFFVWNNYVLVFAWPDGYTGSYGW